MNQAINTCITGLNNIGQGFWGCAAGIFIQSSVLIVLLLVIDFLLHKRVRAVFRYCLWMLVFVKLVLPASFALPTGVGYWLGDYFTRETPIVTFVPQTEEALPITFDIADEYIPLEMPVVSEMVPAGIKLEPICWQGLVFLGWLAGMFLLLALLIQRIYFVRGLIAQSKPANGRLVDILEQCRKQIGIRQNIELRLTGTTLSPAVCGLFKPVILMPAALLEKLSREKVKAVLIHELAHIKRADIWVNLLQTMLQIVYFYNPLVWVANSVVRRVREQAVDEMVLVTLGSETKSYSNLLIDIAEMVFCRPSFGLRLVGVVESKKALEGRIKHMLNRDVPKSSKLGILGLFAIVVIGVIVLPMASGAADEEEMNNIIVAGQVGEYKLGISKSEVLESLGEPKSIFYGNKKYTLKNLPRTYYMCFDDISFRIVDDSVKEMTAVSPLYRFENGLGVGDSEQKIKQAFGDDYHLKKTWKKDFLSYEDKGLVFEIDKNDRTVMEINVSPIESSKSHKKAYIPATSIIDEQGHIVDKIDYPFVNDPQVIGTWEAIDFVGEMDDFKINEKQWEGRGGKLFLHGMIFVKNGRLISKNDKVPRGCPGTWTKGLIIYDNDFKTASKYTLKNMDDSLYMFFEWKSGDYSIRHSKPSYYVLKKVSSETGGVAENWASQPSDAEFAEQLQGKVGQLDIDSAGLEDVKEIFGKPAQYIWESESFAEDNLPNRYIMIYPAGFSVFMFNDQIKEIRFHRPGYVFNDAIQVGSTLEEVIANVGAPEETITGQKLEFKNNVLYEDVDGEKGYCYYHRSDKSVRMFFKNYKVIALFIMRTEPQQEAAGEKVVGKAKRERKIKSAKILGVEFTKEVRRLKDNRSEKHIFVSRRFTLANLKDGNIKVPDEVREQMREYGISFDGIVKMLEEGVGGMDLLDVEEKFNEKAEGGDGPVYGITIRVTMTLEYGS